MAKRFLFYQPIGGPLFSIPEPGPTIDDWSPSWTNTPPMIRARHFAMMEGFQKHVVTPVIVVPEMTTWYRQFAQPQYPTSSFLMQNTVQVFEPLTAILGYQIDLMGAHRIADNDQDRYEMWINTDPTLPDLTANPDATGPLPLAFTTAAGVTYWVTLKKRNKWGLLAQNYKAYRLEVGGGGVIVTNLPSAPTDVSGSSRSGGTIRIVGRYAYHDDGDDQADIWKVYATVGSDPDPANDTAVASVSMKKNSHVASLLSNLAGYSHGDVVHVIVTAHRSSDSEQSSNTTAIQVTVDALGPMMVDAATQFGREKFVQI